jgi:pimeloyl-ACP methyl ester carboxylesterase
MAGAWVRRLDTHPLASLRQLAASSYIPLFRAPFLPEALVRAGIVDRLVDHSARTGHGSPTPRAGRRPTRDLVNGLELYRANMRGRATRSAPARAVVPVQVLAPAHDPHVVSRMQREAPAPYVDTLVSHVIDGNHWVVAQRPDVIAQHLRDFISYVG